MSGFYGIRTKRAKATKEYLQSMLKHGQVQKVYVAPIDDKVYRNRVFTWALRNKGKNFFCRSVINQVLYRKQMMTDEQFFTIERLMKEKQNRREMKNLELRNKGFPK